MKIRRVPYLVESNGYTVKGPILTFNGQTHPTEYDTVGAKELSQWEIHKIIRVECGWKFRYFLQGKEINPKDYFLDI
jgi:hypothetical protein